MANNQNKNDKNQNDILTLSKENYEKLLKQISELTNKNLKENKKLNEKEQKYLLDMQMRSLNKLKEERLKAIALEIEQIERLKKETLKKLNEEYFALERNIKLSSDKIKIEKDERDKAFNEFESIKNKTEKLISSGRIRDAKLLDDELKQKEKYYKEIESSLYNQQNGMKESIKLLEEKNVAIAEIEAKEEDNANNRITTLKKEKEEIQRIRKEHSDEYEEKSRQQRLVNDLYYESIRKQKESLGWKNKVIDEFTGVFSMFGEGTKILGTSSKFLLDVMTKPSKKKIEEKVQTDFGGLSTHTSPSPTPEIQQPEPEVEKKQPIEPQSPPVKVEKKQPVEQPVKQSTVEKQILEEKTTNNIEKSKISLNREERYQKTYEAFKNIKDNPRVKKKEIYNASRRKSAKSDIENKNADILSDIAPIEKAEDKKEEKNRFEKLNKSMDGVKEAVEKTQGFALIQMMQMVAVMGGLAITMGLWYDLWKQKKELDNVIKDNNEERKHRVGKIEAQQQVIDDIGEGAEESGKFTKEELEEYENAKKEYAEIEKKQLEREERMKPTVFGILGEDGDYWASKIEYEKDNPKQAQAYEKIMKTKVMKETKGSYEQIRNAKQLTEKEKIEKSDIEKKQKEEIKNQKIDSESFYKVTEEDRGITESQRVTTELETAKMKTQKEAGTPSVTVNVPTNDESTSLLGDILDVLSNRQPTTELK